MSQKHGACAPRPLSDFVDKERLWRRLMALGEFGNTGCGGVSRQALSKEHVQACQQVVAWAESAGATAGIDEIGNLFMRVPGANPDRSPIMTGSHLDSQPRGGLFDGTYGVLAGLEVLEAFAASGQAPLRPLELVVWQNEEGCRFSPSTMGSGVYVGALDLAETMRASDRDGVTVEDALHGLRAEVEAVRRASDARSCHAYIEAHIEQGPVLEDAGVPIGVVTGVQGLRQYRVRIKGRSAHAGTTPRSKRQDAVVAAATMISALDEATQDADDLVRFTVGQMEVRPNSMNTIAEEVVFSIDLRHPDEERLEAMERQIERAAGKCTPCDVDLQTLIKVPSIQFDPVLIEATEITARKLGISSRLLASGATHDARFMATLFPASMIFVPCRDGISHNESEWAEPEHLWSGARVLANLVQSLCADGCVGPSSAIRSEANEVERVSS